MIDEFIENYSEQTTVNDLVERMYQISPEPYTSIYMRQKIEKHLGQDVIITNIYGRDNVITIRLSAAKILQEFYDSPKAADEEAEKGKMLELRQH